MINNQIFLFFYNFTHQSQCVDKLIIFFAQYFPYFVILGAIFFLIFHHDVFNKEKPFTSEIKKMKELFYVISSVFFAWIFSVLLKLILHIPRPFLSLENINPLLYPLDYSLPSGHSALFMAIATAIFLYHKKIGCYFIFFAILIGFARIMAGVHYPLDILFGFLIGFLISFLLIKFFRK